MLVAIVNLGVGNVKSVVNMITSLGIAVTVLDHGQDLGKWNHVVIPGVGSFDAAAKQIDDRGWRTPLRDFHAAQEGHLLGICLGAQLLGESSEEGALAGLGLLPFTSKRLTANPAFRVPQMGWRELEHSYATPAWLKPAIQGRFYFSHSYFIEAPPQLTLARTVDRAIPAVLGTDTILGVQFHPEKSHKHGRRFLEAVLRK